MKVVYTAPNRAHHYRYALALHTSGSLHAFVSGFPRLSPRAKLPQLAGKLYRADFFQSVYIASLRIKTPALISNYLAYLSKIEQDYACKRFVANCDIFLFYSGSGLNSTRYGKLKGAINIVEAVNSHVEYQEELLKEEHESLGLPWQPFPEYEKRRRMQEYEEADYILLPSEFVRNSFLVKGFPKEKLLKVPYGFDRIHSSKAKPVNQSPDEHFTVLYVGSLSVRKGIRYLVEAFAKLQHPKKKLVLVGPDAADNALKGISLTPDIVLTGALKGDQLVNEYQTASVFCLPSIEEGLALVLGEALSFGLPLIATINTGVEDIIVDGQEGYVVPIRDIEAIFHKLQLLADNPDVLAQMSTNSYLKSANLDGWQQTGINLVNTLQNIYSRAYTN